VVARISGRLLTGPAAFFVAWVIDVIAYAVRRGRP
jgi:sorbitol-specific phosphotransferase system component IIBC